MASLPQRLAHMSGKNERKVVLTIRILRQTPTLPPPILRLIGDVAIIGCFQAVTETISSIGRLTLFWKLLVIQIYYISNVVVGQASKLGDLSGELLKAEKAFGQ